MLRGGAWVGVPILCSLLLGFGDSEPSPAAVRIRSSSHRSRTRVCRVLEFAGEGWGSVELVRAGLDAPVPMRLKGGYGSKGFWGGIWRGIGRQCAGWAPEADSAGRSEDVDRLRGVFWWRRLKDKSDDDRAEVVEEDEEYVPRKIERSPTRITRIENSTSNMTAQINDELKQQKEGWGAGPRDDAGYPERHDRSPRSVLRFFRAGFSSLRSRLTYHATRLAWAALFSATLHPLFLKSAVLPPKIRTLATIILVAALALRVLHLVLSFAIVPSSWLYSPDGYSFWMHPEIRRFSLHNRARCRHGRVTLERRLGGVPVRIKTADGGLVGAMHFTADHGVTDAPTVMRLNGNGEAYELLDPNLVLKYLDKGVNVLLVNYRGVVLSRWQQEGLAKAVWHMPWPRLARMVVAPFAAIPRAFATCVTREKQALLYDVEAALMYLTRGLGVRREDVLIVGHSIGGAIGSLVAASHPKVGLCSSRSFSKLSEVVAFHGAALLEGQGLAKKIVTNFCWFLCRICGWELSARTAWRKVRGYKWTEYCDEDLIVPFDLSLQKALYQARARAGSSSGPWGGETLKLKSLIEMDNHNRPLTDGEMEEHLQLVLHAFSISPGEDASGGNETTI